MKTIFYSVWSKIYNASKYNENKEFFKTIVCEKSLLFFSQRQFLVAEENSLLQTLLTQMVHLK